MRNRLVSLRLPVFCIIFEDCSINLVGSCHVHDDSHVPDNNRRVHNQRGVDSCPL